MRCRRLALLLPVLLLLAGCWDFRGLEQRGLVVIAGIDRTEEGNFRFSAQLPLARSGQQRTGGSMREDLRGYRVLVAEGKTVREAFQKVRADIAREVDPSLLDTIVIGEAAAKDLEDLDWIVRSIRVPIEAYIAVAKGKAEDVVQAQTPGVVPPGEYARFGFIGSWTRSPAVVPTPLWLMFNRKYFTPLEDPFAPAMTAEKYGLNWDGLAVFQGHHLAGFLTERETEIFNAISGHRMELTVEAEVPSAKPGAKASFFVQRGRSRRWVTWERGKPVFHVDFYGSGDLRELNGIPVLEAGTQAAVEAALARSLATEIRQILQKLQELGSDPLGFGEMARRRDPYRPEVGSGAAWHKAYGAATIDAVAQIKIISTGFMR